MINSEGVRTVKLSCYYVETGIGYDRFVGLHTCAPSTSRPFLCKGPQNSSAIRETPVRAPSHEAAQQQPADKPASAKPPEKQQVRPPPLPSQIGAVDIEAFSRNLARLVEEGGRALAAYIKPREHGREDKELADEVTEVVKTLSQVAEYWLADPQRAVEVQTSLGKAYLELWAAAVKRLAGEPTAPVATPASSDRRFSDPEWTQNQYFDFLKQAYLLTAQWADKLVAGAADLDLHTKQKAEFYVRQITNAMAPTNFVLTNPELLRETLTSNADNLVRGMHMLAEDIERGGGHLKIRQSDSSMFEVGRNLAITPGKIIYQNELMQLIQYAPTTKTVLKRPILIVPPWINKFYVLDLTPEKSFIKWCVDQGLTVFCISWVNPDERLAQKTFDDYVREGPLAALYAIKRATGEDKVHAIGYCVGGTLLAITLAAMAAKKDQRIVSATLFASQVDFTYAGDLKVFVDEEQLAALEKRMSERGYLDSGSMATVFNMLRSNDLLWPYVIDNYLKGKAPFPFDLLYWNSDATRMPAANHSFYLRNCYLDNTLAKGKMTLDNTLIDLEAVRIPIYNLATREDHIAPAKSVMFGSKFFGGNIRFVVAGSGHIAGVINPPAKNKYQFWTGPKPRNADIDGWLAKAKEHPGSWWPDWLDWITKQGPTEVPSRKPGAGSLKPIEDAPGSYVKVRD
jgi:polyhydroxyalkanoate synthase subunit PhaC